MRVARVVLIFVVSFVMLSGVALAINVLQNGGFELGSSDWTLNSAASVVSGGHDGSAYALQLDTLSGVASQVVNLDVGQATVACWVHGNVLVSLYPSGGSDPYYSDFTWGSMDDWGLGQSVYTITVAGSYKFRLVGYVVGGDSVVDACTVDGVSQYIDPGTWGSGDVGEGIVTVPIWNFGFFGNVLIVVVIALSVYYLVKFVASLVTGG